MPQPARALQGPKMGWLPLLLLLLALQPWDPCVGADAETPPSIPAGELCRAPPPPRDARPRGESIHRPALRAGLARGACTGLARGTCTGGPALPGLTDV